MPLDILLAMVSRTLRVIRLDAAVFREIAYDRGTTYQALAIVFLGGVSTASRRSRRRP